MVYRRISDAVASFHLLGSSRRLDVRLAALSGVPLRFGALGVLNRIVDHGPVGLHELSRLVRMQPAGLSRQLRVLDAEGYISRSVDPADGRAAVVRATAQGRSASRHVRAAISQMLAHQLRDWSDRDLELAAELMERLDGDLRRRTTTSRSAVAATEVMPRRVAAAIDGRGKR
jgi:DNA-binding MarR family transcriptional regulator